MKKNSLMLIIILVLLVVIGWGEQFNHIATVNKEYNAHLKGAVQYCEDGLYQKAIECYNSALLLKDNLETRELWIDTYEKAYLDGVVTVSRYGEVLTQMCELFPSDIGNWEKLLTFHMNRSDIGAAYESYLMCSDAGVTSDLIKGYANDILYSFKTASKSYDDYVRNATGYYTVYDGNGWGIVRPSGDKVYDCVYDYISPYNENYYALFVSSKGQRIVDASVVIQAKIDITFKKTGAYSSGLLPVNNEDGTWRYLDCKTNKFILGTYEYASNFANGIAAVCKDGKWTLINISGEQVCDTVFSDIKVHSNGNYVFDGVMIAAVNGEYGVFTANGDSSSSFRATDMDIYMGGYIAYRDSSGKWGFVAKDGTKVQDARFVQAKSFSNNLAAVSDGEAWGFVNPNGEVVIGYQFISADYFTSDCVCMVSMVDGRYNLIQLRFFNK